jgi:hypothetical protein
MDAQYIAVRIVTPVRGHTFATFKKYDNLQLFFDESDFDVRSIPQ